MKPRDEGFTIIESMIALFLFSLASAAFYSVLLAGTRSSHATEDVARISEEARAGLNRMIRDTREGQLFAAFQPDSYDVRVDFDGDGVYEDPNEDGDYEVMNFRYDAVSRAILLNGEILVAGVEPLPGVDIFRYTSNDLRYDWDGNGVTTQSELEEAATRGYAGVDGTNTAFYSNVHFAFSVRVDEKVSDFRGQAQLRNRR